MIHENISDLIGNTPLVKLNTLPKTNATVVAKLENLNPGGSVKDRTGRQIIKEAEEQGLLKPGATIIESTSGNTGLGLIMATQGKDYKHIYVIPSKSSEEKVKVLRALGAKVILTPTVAKDHPNHYNNVAARLHEETEGSFLADQFFNLSNPRAHYQSTGPEIWEQTDGKITHFVCGMGTGGTMTGVSKYLKEKNSNIKIIGVDPIGSIIKQFFEEGEHDEAISYKVEGIGKDFIPGTLDLSNIDEIYSISDKDSFLFARRLAEEEGIFSGGSTGALAKIACDISKDLNEDNIVLFIVSDIGDRYLSKLYNDEWMLSNEYIDKENTNE
jgi:cystathionine beta-synthase